jgi:hypothetical protein
MSGPSAFVGVELAAYADITRTVNPGEPPWEAFLRNKLKLTTTKRPIKAPPD